MQQLSPLAATCLKPLRDYGCPEQQSVGFLASFISLPETGELLTSAGTEDAWIMIGTHFSMGRRRLGKYDTSFRGRSSCGLCAAILLSVFSSVQWQSLEGMNLLTFIKMRIVLYPIIKKKLFSLTLLYFHFLLYIWSLDKKKIFTARSPTDKWI